MDNLLELYVLRGGPMMFALIPCSIIMVGAVFQGMIRLRRGRVLPRQFEQHAGTIGDPAARREFIVSLRGHATPLGRAAWLTLKPFRDESAPPSADRLEPAMDEAVAQVADDLHDGLSLLSTLYTIAPLLGLMGTILGMMEAFQQFAVAEQRSVRLLSVGIQQALVTTLWGLGIAIPAFAVAQWMQTRIHRYERDGLPTALNRIVQRLYAEPPAREDEA